MKRNEVIEWDRPQRRGGVGGCGLPPVKLLQLSLLRFPLQIAARKSPDGMSEISELDIHVTTCTSK